MNRSYVLVLGLVMLVGCASDGPPNVTPDASYDIVGTWSYDQAPAGDDVAYKFGKDGGFESWYTRGGKSSRDTGTYKLEGKNLTIDIERHVSVFGNVNTDVDPQTITLTWLSRDRFKLSDPKTSNTWTRRK